MSKAIASEWNTFRLCELTDIRSSNVDKKSIDGEITVRLCNYTDVYYNNQITNKLKFMIATAKQSQIDRFRLECGDVIITKDSETPDDIAIPAYVAESLNDVLCGYHLTLIRPNKDKACGRFLTHLFGLPKVRHHFYVLANGITRYGLNIDAIENAPIQTPPLPEQQKIAAILTAVDEVIETTQAQINKLKDLKAGMMQELLTKGIGHTEFKDSAVGRIPKSWSFSTIGTLADQVKPGPFGSSITKSMYVDSGFRVYGQEQVIAGDLKIGNYYITSEKYEELVAFQIRAGEILISLVGTFGQILVVPENFEPGIINPRLLKLRMPKEKVDPTFIAYQLKSNFVIDQLNKFQQGRTMGVLSGTTLKPVALVVPSLEEQKEIANSLCAVDQNIFLKERKKELLLKQKKALMQDLLTGKVRVKTSTQ